MIIKAGCKQAGGFIGGAIGTAFGCPDLGRIIGRGVGDIIGRLVDTGGPEEFFQDSVSEYTTQMAADLREFGFSPLDIF